VRIQALRALAIGEDDDISPIPIIPSDILNGRGPKSKTIMAAPERQNRTPIKKNVMNIHLDLTGAFMGPSWVMKKISDVIIIGFVVGSSYYNINLVVGKITSLLLWSQYPVHFFLQGCFELLFRNFCPGITYQSISHH
jgi:hypothetical protein